MTKVKLTLVKSVIDRSKRQKDTVRALGLRKMNQSVEHDVNHQIKGMIDKVAHLIKIEEI